jgi:NitT/TauT family transport system substrate-binding protein
MNRAAFTALTGVALAAGTRPARAQTAATIRIALIPIETAAEVFYAKELGSFAKAGLAVDLQQLQNGQAIAAAVAGGAADIGFSTVPPLAVAHSKGIPLTIIAGAALSIASEPFALVVVNPDSPIKAPKDLSGKTVGIIGLGTVADFGTRAWIDRNGGDSTAIKFAELPAPAMPAALAAGRVDAALLVEPYLTQGRAQHDRILGNPMDGVAKEFAVSVWFSTPSWAGAHPDLVGKFAAVMHDTALWAAKNPARSVEILAQYTKVDPGSLAGITRVRYADHLTAAMIAPVVDVAAKYGKFPAFAAQELLFTPPR